MDGILYPFIFEVELLSRTFSNFIFCLVINSGFLEFKL